MFPGAFGPYPLRPALYVAAAAACVMPCHDPANDTISCPPVTSFAIRTAASLDSAPVVSSNTFVSGPPPTAPPPTGPPPTGPLLTGPLLTGPLPTGPPLPEPLV